MPTNAGETVAVRLIVLSPPVEVVLAVQSGRTELLPPVRRTERAWFFEFPLRLTARAGESRDAAPVLRGPTVQGRLDDLFIYLNSGRRAGDPASPWDRRAKVRLVGVTPALIAKWRAAVAAGQRCFLAARFAGTARDGGPVCGGVPLLDGGWRVETVRGTPVVHIAGGSSHLKRAP